MTCMVCFGVLRGAVYGAYVGPTADNCAGKEMNTIDSLTARMDSYQSQIVSCMPARSRKHILHDVLYIFQKI